jgi:hypothetical protein
MADADDTGICDGVGNPDEHIGNNSLTADFFSRVLQGYVQRMKHALRESGGHQQRELPTAWSIIHGRIAYTHQSNGGHVSRMP